MANMTVKLLGTRGSMPVSGARYAGTGGATLCVRVELCGMTLYLDAGTGLLNDKCEVSESHGPGLTAVFLSHPHADHIMGLACSPLMMSADRTVHIYAAERHGLDTESQIESFMSPPVWPVGIRDLPADPVFHDLDGRPVLLADGRVRVEYMEGDHPGGVSVYKISCGDRSLVYMTDCTIGRLGPQGPVIDEKYTGFARGCSILLVDGQYSDKEWRETACSSYGHSTWSMAAELGRLCGAGKVRIIHHDHDRTDQELEQNEHILAAKGQDISFGYDGELIDTGDGIL